jgi:hypothetical protein
MSADQLFSICNVAVLPGWLLLAFVPRWQRTQVIAGMVIPLALAVIYLALLVSQWSVLEGSFGSLSGVAQLFENPYALLAGWIHYLAFDLFIGSWEVRDAQRLKIHHAWVLPCLLFTFLLGPFGLMLYFVLRTGLRRKLMLPSDE